MLLKLHAALLHLDQHDWFPDVIGKRHAASVFAGFADAELRDAAYVETAGLIKGLEEPVEEDLGLSLFVTRDVGGAPLDKGLKFFRARHDDED